MKSSVALLGSGTWYNKGQQPHAVAWELQIGYQGKFVLQDEQDCGRGRGFATSGGFQGSVNRTLAIALH